MADAGMFVEEERRPKQPLNNEEGNLRDGELWVYLNALEEISTENGPFNFYSNSMESCVSQ